MTTFKVLVLSTTKSFFLLIVLQNSETMNFKIPETGNMLYWNTEYSGMLRISHFKIIFISTEKTSNFFP